VATTLSILYTPAAVEDLASLRADKRTPIREAIEQQLAHQPAVLTRNRKKLEGLVPPWEHVPPVWELRVGDCRIFYDVDETAARVVIRRVLRKPPHLTTADIIEPKGRVEDEE
jgi:mRNA-degrading endonuclease RelE of RelBE toxin-antitoxin system